MMERVLWEMGNSQGQTAVKEKIQMNIGVLGTGIVGRTIGEKLVELGHAVVIGTRDVADTLARTNTDRMGNAPFKLWQEQHAQIKLGTFAEAAAFGEIIFTCTSGQGTLEALTLADASNLQGKVIVDTTNALDFSRGFPPTLFVCNDDSLGEQIQRSFPEAKVVKSLNTMTAYLMVNPGLVAGDHDVFVSGDDAGAKAQVTALLKEFGWQSVVDLGDITTARGVEMMMLFWLTMMGKLQTSKFNYKIVH
jgi:8-hydroxy-5-deazaflavin:NADPH oxidoreductase